MLQALGNRDIDGFREAVSRVREVDRTAVLTSPNTEATLRLQTPLMAAAATGVFGVYVALLSALDEAYMATDSVSESNIGWASASEGQGLINKGTSTT